MSSRKKQQLSFYKDGNTAFVSLDEMEIWDGADLSLLRDVLSRLVRDDGNHSIGVDLSSVKYIPSGFFGMLFEWYEAGISISLRSPQEHVENMLWFRMFFIPDGADMWKLCDDSMRDHSPNEQVEHHRRMFAATADEDSADCLEDSEISAVFPATFN